MLSATLHKIAPNIKDYGDGAEFSETQYIKSAVNAILLVSDTALEFITKFAELLVYLQEVPFFLPYIQRTHLQNFLWELKNLLFHFF